MKKTTILILMFLLTNISFGQIVTKKGSESNDDFVKRFKPVNSEVTHKIIETKWNQIPVIIAFYDQTYKLPKEDDPDQQDYHRLLGTIFFQIDSSKYNKTFIDTFDSEGGDPFIESVFFAGADNDLEKELVVITSWPQQHAAVNGTLYATSIYDNILKPQSQLKLMKEISKKVDGGCECTWDDGTSKKSKFKTAGDIRKELTRLGYK